MNTASLELCRELYELSGWGNPDDSESDDMLTWCANRGGELTPWNPTERSDYSFPGFIETEIPAYDLGYLLRKLPAHASVHKLGRGKEGQFYAEHHKTPFGEIRQDADTPEDAAAKLAIELFKQNVLTKA